MAGGLRTGTKAVLVAFVLLPLVPVLGLYFASVGIPFLEGTEFRQEGAWQGFVIGESRQATLDRVKSRGCCRLQLVWDRDSEAGRVLGPDVGMASPHGYNHRTVPVGELRDLDDPLRHVDRWQLMLDGEWVDSIYLDFAGDRLVAIGRDRWLFERP